MSAAEMKQIIAAAGLKCDSCHYGFKEMKENLDERIAFAKALGLKQMICSSFGLPKAATLDDWKKAADELNSIGEKTKKAGLQCGFHNHHGEFAELGGVLIYDELMRRLDPKLVKMQFQVAVVSIGFEAATYMTKYPGRILSLHLADWSATEKKTRRHRQRRGRLEETLRRRQDRRSEELLRRDEHGPHARKLSLSARPESLT